MLINLQNENSPLNLKKYKIVELQSKPIIEGEFIKREQKFDIFKHKDSDSFIDVNKKLFPYSIELIYKQGNIFTHINEKLHRSVQMNLYLWVCFIMIQYKKVKSKICEFDLALINEIENDVKSVLHQDLYFKYIPMMNKITFYQKVEEYYDDRKWLNIILEKSEKIVYFLKIWFFILN